MSNWRDPAVAAPGCRAPAEDGQHFLVRHLGKRGVELSRGMKFRRRRKAHHFVGIGPNQHTSKGSGLYFLVLIAYT